MGKKYTHTDMTQPPSHVTLIHGHMILYLITLFVISPNLTECEIPYNIIMYQHF